MSLCTPTANNIVRIHINSWRICLESFSCLEMSTTNQSALVLRSNGDIIVISSQTRVFVCIDPFHRIDLATCFGELPYFFTVKITPALNFIHFFHSVRLVSLSESSLHIGRAGWEVKVSFTVLLLQHFLLIAFCAFQPSSLEEIHSSGVRNAPFGTNMRHLVASQLPSLHFWLVSKIVRAVLAFHQSVSVSSRVTNQQEVTVPATLLLFRVSGSPFASLSSSFVLAPTFPSSRSSSFSSLLAVFDGSATVRLRGTFINEALLCLSVCREG